MKKSLFTVATIALTGLAVLLSSSESKADRLLPFVHTTMRASSNMCTAQKRALQRAKSKLRQATTKNTAAQKKADKALLTAERAQDKVDSLSASWDSKIANTIESYQRDLDNFEMDKASIQVQINVLQTQGCNEQQGCDIHGYQAQIANLNGQISLINQRQQQVVAQRDREVALITSQKNNATASARVKLDRATAAYGQAKLDADTKAAALDDAQTKYDQAQDAFDACS